MPAGSEADDRVHAVWMYKQLERAADEFKVTVAGEPRQGWRNRTIGARVTTGDGDRWLRVTSEMAWWADGEFWTGNVDAQAIANVPMPSVITRHDWADGDRKLYAELMTLLSSPTVADTMVLRQFPDLDARWWADLRAALNTLASHRADRVSVNGYDLRLRLLAAFGIDIDLTALEYTCAHGDLQWSNLTAPSLCLLDWEALGVAPAGYDAAVLFCSSILQPEVANIVHTTFAYLLETPTGLVAQLAAATKFLRHVEQGDNIDIAAPLHGHCRRVIDQLGSSLKR